MMIDAAIYRSRFLSITVCSFAFVSFGANSQPEANALTTLHVRDSMYLIAGDGANITASIGPDGVFLVDSGAGTMSDEILVEVASIQSQLAESKLPPVGGAETRSAAQFLRAPAPPPDPVRYIVNTHFDPDHIGGNQRIAITAREMSFQSPLELATRIFAHENVLLRMSGVIADNPELPYEMWPTDTYFSNTYKFSSHFNGDGIQLVHVRAARTDGDTIVWFRNSDVVAAGGIFSMTNYPTPRLEMGGSINGVIEGLNVLVDLALPEYRAEGGTIIVPAYGRLADFGDIIHYRDLVTIIRDRVQHMIDQGMSLRQIKSARPSLEYDPRYAKEPGSSDRFIEAVYESLMNDAR
jgi:cyclase